jgi:hypothetical protein
VQGCCGDGPEVRHDMAANNQIAAEQESKRKAIIAWNTRAHVEELMLCESRRLVLKKDKLYIFTVDPTCPKCVELDSKYGEKDG